MEKASYFCPTILESDYWLQHTLLRHLIVPFHWKTY
jgi:hypothetical protein